MIAKNYFTELTETRHSGRTYDPTQNVSEKILDQLIHTAHLSPSCYNEQPWIFLIADKSKHSSVYSKIFDSLVEFNQGWCKDAPILIVVIASLTFKKNGNPNRWSAYDTGAAAFAMMLEASNLGLMAHQMGGFDEQKIIKDFNLSKNIFPMAVMALGYEKTGEPIPPKDREPLKNHFFFGKITD